MVSLSLTVILSLAVVVLATAVILLVIRTNHTETEIYEIKRNISIIGGQADSGSAEIDGIINRLNEITADIGRMDAEVKYQQTRMNVVYPWFENSEYNTKKNGGVPWASEVRCKEDGESINV